MSLGVRCSIQVKYTWHRLIGTKLLANRLGTRINRATLIFDSTWPPLVTIIVIHHHLADFLRRCGSNKVRGSLRACVVKPLEHGSICLQPN